MKQFSILCCLVLLLNVLCPVGHVHAEDITTPTDLCSHTNYGYWADGDDCVYGCLDCKRESWRDQHYAACDDPTRCKYCGLESELLDVFHRLNYVSDGAAGHHGVCETCGLVEETWEHDASCTNPTHCSACGYEGEIGNITHPYNEWVSFGAEGCGYICTECGYKYVQNHLGRCDDSTHCLLCDYEGECTSISHDYDWSTGISDGAKSHHLVCLNCGQERTYAHYASCDNPNVCSVCGYEGKIANIIHNWFDYVSDGVAGHHTVCNTCGYVAETWEHRANCYNPTHCTYCDYEGEIESLTHVGETFVSYGEEGCGYICTKCGYKYIQDHQAFCTDNTPNVCNLCGYKGEIPVIFHTYSGMDGYDDTNHWYTCLVCGETITLEHTWGTPVTDGNKTTYTCQVCDATKIEGASTPTAEPTVEPTAEPTVEPTTEPTVTATPTPDLDYEPDETATPAPTKKPEAQPTVAPTAEPAHTHSYDACVSNGSGSHTQTCAECGETVNVTCTMVDTKIGNLDASSCIYCGYITWKLGAVTDDAQGESLQEDTQEAKIIENAVFELVDEAGESIVTESMSLTVYESAPEVTIQLDTGANVVVKKALTITVQEDSTPVKLASTVKLSIPMEDDPTGLKLLVMDENGELVEIAYEVVDGVMVFETDILGIFMLVEEI